MSSPLSTSGPSGSGSGYEPKPIHNLQARLFGAWAFVGIPLAYGIVQTVRRAAALFTG